MRVILAGMGSPIYVKTVKHYGMVKLYSALNERRQIEKWDTGYPLMVDSGAHSWNKTSLNVVGGKASNQLPPLKQWCDHILSWYAALDHKNFTLVEMDVYAELPMDYIDSMARLMMATLKQATYMRVYHLMLDGGSLRVLKQWLDDGHTYIGLGLDSMPVWGKVFNLTRDRIKYHGFAATRQEVLLRYPLYSADSSTAIAGARYGGNYCNGKYVSKQQLAKMRSPLAVVDETDKRIQNGVKAMYEMQEHVTKVWERRGITWS
jgi:hypothetical protein